MTDLAFHALAAKVHAARSAADLAFIFCNETHALASYRQAALVGFFGARRTRLAAHSGLADIDANSPYALWLADVANHVRKQLDALPASARVLALSPAMLPAALAAQWADWMPDHVWVMSLAGPDGRSRAALFLGREMPWPTEFDAGAPEYLLLQAAAMYGHAWWALTERRRSVGAMWSNLWARRAFRWALVALPLALLVPVREYALVPAEVVSNRSQVISSPREGVIKRMVVKPNTPVEAGAVLAELDDSTLYNRQAVAQAALASARVDLLQASQRAIETQAAKAELNIADMDRGYYADHALTLAQHPSENDERLMLRLVAFVLYAHEYLAFTKGLSDPDEPDIWQKDLTGAIDLWIDLGQPDEKRVLKACGRSRQVAVITYGNAAPIWWEGIAPKLERARNLSVRRLVASGDTPLAAFVQKNMKLQCTVQDGQLWLSDGERSAQVDAVTLR